ncbi:MAG: hypothetical protein HFF25_07355 [Oscillospiraceae bacterium]|jgi:hypothetical protein|nr:hypothetical protein [Oscillospiraceae bacterium]MCI9289634.1 hypothetical protein [Oscillospiraceae bacterium]MCI9551351.1 hypothetical protein [Oscillospiraceae bacterium]
MGANTKKKRMVLIALACLLLLAVGGGIFLMTREEDAAMDDSLQLDDNATMGVLPGIDMKERQAQLQEQLDEGMIAFSINTSPVFATGGSEGNLMLENPANNAKLLVVEIYIDATQEMVYQSKAIPTGAYIENARLDKVLEPGEYPATAYFKAYREEDHSFIGQAGAAIKITVLS